MMMKAVRIVAVAVAWTMPAAAQTVAPVPAQTAVSPGEAQQALAVLRDDARRAQLIATLDAIAKLSPKAAPAATPGAAVPVVAPAGGVAPVAAPGVAAPVAPATVTSTLPLEPDSLGAQFIAQTGAALSSAGTQLAAAVHSVNDLPLLWRWVAAQASDADARARLMDVFGKLLAVVAAALGAEAAGHLVLRRVRAAVSRGAHATPAEAPPDDPTQDVRRARGAVDRDVLPDDVLRGLVPESGLAAAEAGESERSARQRRLTGALSALRRLPFLAGRLLLDLVPIALFGTVGYVLLGTALGQPAVAGLVILVVLHAYLAARVLLAVAGMLMSPSSARLRLLHISGWAAEFLTRWLRRVAVLAVTGYAVSEVALALGMYRSASDALLKLVALAVHGCLVAAVLEARVPVAARIRVRRVRAGVWAVTRNRLGDIWHLVAVFYIVALWFVWAVELRNGYARLLHFFLVTVAVIVVSRLLAVVLLGGLDRLLLGPRLAVRHPGLEARIAYWYPIGRFLLMVVVGVLTALALLEVWGFPVIGWFGSTGLGGRVVSAVTLIGVTVLLAVVVWEAANAGLESQIAKLRDAGQFPRAGRLRTLMPMLRAALMVVIVLVVALTALSELGINIAPLLAGAGVVGIAVGFGSQKLVQDLITGVFLLLEDAMQVGDVVTLGGLSGTVEALWIRTIRLRALDGSVHIVPFSAVTTVTNQTRDYGFAVLDISVGLNEEPEPVIEAVREVAEEMRADAAWAEKLLEPLDVMGVEKFIDTAWVLRARIKTLPAARWAVGRELNRRIKVRFDERAIESPFTSHRVLSTNPAAPDATPSEPVHEEVHA